MKKLYHYYSLVYFSIVGWIAIVFRASSRFHTASRDVSESKCVRLSLKNVRLGRTDSL